MLKEIITINKGYKIMEQTTTVDAPIAYGILSTKKQFKYTSAEYLVDTKQVILKKHIMVCPHCNAHKPAYRHFIYDYDLPKQISASYARRWCYDLRPFFAIENDELYLYEPVKDVKRVECPVCGQMSSTSELVEDILIEYNKGVIKLTCMLDSIADVINIDWAPTIQVTALPLIESVTFNMKKGTTFFELHNANGELLSIRDVTNGLPVSKKVSKMIRLINSNLYIKRKLIEYFEKAWKGSIPFSINELDFYRATLLTTYVGYTNVNFYYNVPDVSEEGTLEETFKPTRKRLHYSDNCIALIETSGIPKSKSIKSIIYENLYFLFYIKEIEILWNLFRHDHNLLVSFLTAENACANLMTLYTYPGIIDFYTDFARVKSPLELKNMIVTSGKEAYIYGMSYSAFSKRHKLDAQKRWGKIKELLIESYYNLNFTRQFEQAFLTLPSMEKIKHFNEQCINGYKFVALKTRCEFVTAGRQLQNCLGRNSFRDPVIGVMKYGRYVAAIEVGMPDMFVVQAYLAENEPIEKDEDIFAAFKKWCKRNSVNENFECAF